MPMKPGTRIAFSLIFVTSLVLFYVMNTIVPFFSDDMACTYYDNKPITDAESFLKSLVYDYRFINGRLLIDALVLLFVLAGDAVFNVVNTVCFGLAVYLFYRHIHVRDAASAPFFLVLTLVSFFLLSTGIDSLFYWAAGASNYIWALIPTLLFIQLMEHCHAQPQMSARWLLPAGFLLSMYNEMYSFPVCASYLTCWAFRWRRLSRPEVLLLSGFVAGSLLMALAPGNLGREMTYTIGLNYVSRIVKMAYSLRLTYLCLLVLAVCCVRHRCETAAFLRRQAVLLLLFSFSFVIPFISATASRAMFATELFALLLTLRLLNEFSPGRKQQHVATAALFVGFLVFQCAVIRDSAIKWGIYDKAVAEYYHQAGNVVMIDDYQSSNALIEYYTVNLDNIFMPQDKANQLALDKYRQQGRTPREGMADSLDYIKVLPRDVYQAAMVHRQDFFVAQNRVDGIGFHTTPTMMYYVMRYDEATLEAIKCGRLYAYYRILGLNRHVKINYLSDDVGFERAAQAYDTAHGRFIVLNKKYKRYPLLQLERIGLNEAEPHSKIEVF